MNFSRFGPSFGLVCRGDSWKFARYGGFWYLNMANWVRYPSPLFWAFPPWRECEVEVRYPPLERGISAIPARYPMKTRQMVAIPPSAILSRKAIARYGGVSRTGPLRFHHLIFWCFFVFLHRGFNKRLWPNYYAQFFFFWGGGGEFYIARLGQITIIISQ